MAQHTKEMTATFLYSIHAKLSNDQNLTQCASHWICMFVWDFIDVRAPAHQPVWAGCILSVSLHMDRCHPLFSPLYESAKCFRWTDNLLACSYAQSSLGTSSPTLALVGTLAGFAKQLNARLWQTGRWPGLRQIFLFSLQQVINKRTKQITKELTLILLPDLLRWMVMKPVLKSVCGVWHVSRSLVHPGMFNGMGTPCW